MNNKKSVTKKTLTHLILYEDRKNKRTPPIVTPEYSDRIKIVPYHDGWPGDKESTVIVDF